MTRHLALATCDQLPDGEADEQPLIAALAALEVKASLVPWTAPDVDWADFDATVIRTTWDYTARRAEFLGWAASVPRLFNPLPVIAANSDKRYLAGLAAAGLPVVPTAFFEPGSPVVLPATGEYVIKPSVGAGSRGAGRFDLGRSGPAAAEHARALHEFGRTVLVQPYLAGVDRAGETDLVFIDGRFSHAVCKSAMLPPDSRHAMHGAELSVAETIAARQPSADELALAERVLVELSRGLAEPLLYARIDLLPTPAGPVLVEAELIEPSLFLDYAEQATGRLAAAIDRRVG